MSALAATDVDRRADLASAARVVVRVGAALVPAFVAAAFPRPWVLVACWALAGASFSGVSNLLHESAHGLVFRARGASDVLARWVLGPLLLADPDGYRERHWEHHRRLGEPDDPKRAYRVRLGGFGALALVARCLLGLEAAGKMTVQRRGVHGSRTWLARTAAIHAILVTLLAAAARTTARSWREAFVHAGIAWGLVLLYGIASLTVLLATLRAIAEHQQRPGALERLQGSAALRNFRCTPVTRFLFGGFGFAEHLTHHEFPQVPYYRLAPLTARLARDDETFAPRRGYVATLVALRRGPTGA